MEPFIVTYTGRKVNPLALRPKDINIVDIAHHLSTINRFNGALKTPVSVAQHSWFVWKLCRGTKWEKEALFHDAAEAYLGDMTKWVKRHPEMKFFRDSEQAAWLTICEALGLQPEGSPGLNEIVEEADRLMVRYEAMMCGHQNFHEHLFHVNERYPIPSHAEEKKIGSWYVWDWWVAKEQFIIAANMVGYSVEWK